MKQAGYVTNGFLSGTYAGWGAVMLNVIAAAMSGVFLYVLSV